MNRRTLIKWFSRAIGWTCACIVAIPGIRFITEPLRRRSSGGGITQRVVQLANLRVGEPVQTTITGSRQDAWVRYDQETIGRVYLVRETDDTVPPEQSKVKAFTAVCPHLGCAVQFDAGAKTFNCPCHKAFFELSGNPVSDSELGYRNPTPRGMDSLECQVVQEGGTGEWWVEVTYEKFEYGLTTKTPRA